MGLSGAPLFTVLTPTYDRAATLPRLYRSLCRQTFRDFEWLVVDDGSRDCTRDLIEGWQTASVLPIRYVSQPNAGKLAACNKGVAESRSELVAQIDSDDELLPDALQKLVHAWYGIAEAERPNFVGVTGLCVDSHGRVVGDRYPKDRLISDSMETRYRYRIRGEKWGFQRRAVLLEFPFPMIDGLPYVPEGVVWSRIARNYKTLYINEPLRVYRADAPKGRISTRRGFAASAGGVLVEHQNILNTELQWLRVAPLRFLRSAVHYGRASFHLKRSLATHARSLCFPAQLLWIVSVPLAFLVYLRDRAADVRRKRKSDN